MKKYITFSIVLFSILSIAVFGQETNSNLLDNETAVTHVNTNIDNINLKSKMNKCKDRDFTFGVHGYLWTMTLVGTKALPLNTPGLPDQTPEVDISLKFSDALKYLKMAAMFGGNFKYKKVSFLYDIVYAKMQFDGSVPTQSGYIDATTISKQFIGDLNIAYRVPFKDKNTNFDAYGGIRIFSTDETLDLYSQNNPVFTANHNKTLVDPIIGASVAYNFSKRWFTYLKTDIGGFGISSKINWMIMVVGGFRITDHWLTTLGFKNLTINYDKDRFLYDASQYGLLLSIGYRL